MIVNKIAKKFSLLFFSILLLLTTTTTNASNFRTTTCHPPRNVQAIVGHSKKQITLSWQEPIGVAVLFYQVNDWQNRLLWKSNDKSQHCFTDKTLPGTPGKFTYFLYTTCTNGISSGLQFDVIIK